MKRSDRWRLGNQKLKKLITSFTKKTVKFIKIVNLAGLKRVVRAQSGNSYILYDTCQKCPLHIYIDLICNNNLRALVAEGDPADDELRTAKMNLTSEFAELSGNGYSIAVRESLRKIYLYKAQVLGLTASINLIATGDPDVAIEYLKQNGFGAAARLDDQYSAERLLRRIESQIRIKNIRIKEEIKKYNMLSAGHKDAKPTEDKFINQLVLLSKHAGFRLTTDISLAEYAAYLKDLRKSSEELNKYKQMYGKYK